MKRSRIGMYIFAVAAICAAPTATAATWYGIDVWPDDSVIFFDSDTVERTPGLVTVWFKSVQLSSADKDGAWSTAYRWRFNCSARTMQALASSDYDNRGKFIKSYNTSGSANPVFPDSVGEGLLKIACDANFPNSTSEERYWKLFSNDVFEVRDAVVRGRNDRIDQAPK